MTKETTIGGRFRLIREEFGLNQPDLGDLIGVKKSYISKIERGDRVNPDSARISMLASRLGLNYDWIMYGTGEMKVSQETMDSALKEDGGLQYGSLPPRYNVEYRPASSIRLRSMSINQICDLIVQSIPQLREMKPGEERAQRCHYIMDFLFELSNRKE